jgi:hypothetical protein
MHTLTFLGNMKKFAVQNITMSTAAETNPISGPAKQVIDTNSTGHRPQRVISMNTAFFSWNAPLSNNIR